MFAVSTLHILDNAWPKSRFEDVPGLRGLPSPRYLAQCAPMNPESKPDGKPEGETEAKSRTRPLRYSRPPYTVYLIDDPDPALVFPGNILQALGDGLAPTSNEVRAMLKNMRIELRWSRDTMAAVLGVSRAVARRWETGHRNPSGAARRLIWLLNSLMFHRGRIPTAQDLVFWGWSEELRGFPQELARILRETGPLSP